MKGMHQVLIIVSVLLVVPFLGTCDNSEEGKDIPRTVPPASMGSAIAMPDAAPTKIWKKRVKGAGPIYEI